MSNPNDDDRRYTARSLILSAFVAIVGTVLVLQATGRIDHSDNKDHVPVGDFQAIHVKPDEPFRMSNRSSELHAVCEDGYLAIAADVDPSFRGILVDYKNRGVRCARPDPMNPQPAAPAEGSGDDQ
ncbi:MAG: kinase [Pseudomonadota bacterium]|nr:kinase [Pseudomonadota bacterium]